VKPFREHGTVISTWVPEWHNLEIDHIMHSSIIEGEKLYAATGGREAHIRDGHSSANVLVVEGLEFDTVDGLGWDTHLQRFDTMVDSNPWFAVV
jgi:hypothetical protein